MARTLLKINKDITNSGKCIKLYLFMKDFDILFKSIPI